MELKSHSMETEQKAFEIYKEYILKQNKIFGGDSSQEISEGNSLNID